MVQRIKEVSEREKRRNEFNRYKRAWMREWNRQPNPFIALAWWTSEAQRERRKAIYMEFDEDFELESNKIKYYANSNNEM